jgi:hypothetical protein
MTKLIIEYYFVQNIRYVYVKIISYCTFCFFLEEDWISSSSFFFFFFLFFKFI